MGGFSFYYGMFGFIFVSASLLKIQKVDYRFWINEIVPSLLVFHAFSRIGCSLEGCCYGIELNLFGQHLLFPAREIESLALFVMYFLFGKKFKKSRFFWYMLCYSALRFGLEFGRGDDRGVLLLTELSPAQVTSIGIWIALLGWGIYKAICKFVRSQKEPIQHIYDAVSSEKDVVSE